jgi:hypothetical protein
MDSAAVSACSSDHCGGPEGPGGTDRTHHRCRDYLSFCDKKQQTAPVASFFLPVFFSTATLGFEVRDLRGCRGEVTASGLTHGWRGRREARWWRRVAGRDVSGGDTVSRGQWLVSRCAGSVGGSVSSPLRSHQITARTGRGCQIRR